MYIILFVTLAFDVHRYVLVRFQSKSILSFVNALYVLGLCPCRRHIVSGDSHWFLSVMGDSYERGAYVYSAPMCLFGLVDESSSSCSIASARSATYGQVLQCIRPL
jgi:hypothetical protein